MAKPTSPRLDRIVDKLIAEVPYSDKEEITRALYPGHLALLELKKIECDLMLIINEALQTKSVEMHIAAAQCVHDGLVRLIAGQDSDLAQMLTHRQSPLVTKAMNTVTKRAYHIEAQDGGYFQGHELHRSVTKRLRDAYEPVIEAAREAKEKAKLEAAAAEPETDAPAGMRP
jgi:hypothetical protein